MDDLDIPIVENYLRRCEVLGNGFGTWLIEDYWDVTPLRTLKGGVS